MLNKRFLTRLNVSIGGNIVVGRTKYKGTVHNQKWPLQGFAPASIKQNTTILKHVRPPKAQPFMQQRMPHEFQSLMLYEEVDPVELNNSDEEDLLEVILTKYIEEYGNRGDVIKLPKDYARRELILSGSAVYASPFNLQLFASESATKPDSERGRVKANLHSIHLARIFDQVVLQVHIRSGTTLSPWHIALALRRKGIHIQESSLKLNKWNFICDEDSDGTYFHCFVLIDQQVLAQLIGRICLITETQKDQENVQAILLAKAIGQQLTSNIDNMEAWIAEGRQISSKDLISHSIERIPHYIHPTPTLTLEQSSKIMGDQLRNVQRKKLEEESKKVDRFATKTR